MTEVKPNYMVASNTNIPNYKKILVPHDGTEMSDKSLLHAATLALLSKGEVVILNVVDEHAVPPSTLLSFLNEKGVGNAKENLRQTLESAGKRFLEEKIRICKEKRVENVSYTLKVGKPTDEIVNAAEELDADLIVMASSRISSLVHVLGSTARKVIDSTKRPVLIVHG